MIEETILSSLSTQLSVPVYMEEPQTPPSEYVLAEKTGSSESGHIRSAVIAVQSYADSLYKAALLNEEVKKAMNILAELPCILRCRLNSDYNYTDTETKRYRYQAVFNVTYY